MNFNYEGRNKIAELVDYNRFAKKNEIIVFFENKLLAITRESSYKKNITKEITDKYKAEGLGFFKRRAKVDEYWNNFGDRFYYMSEEEIAKAFKKIEEIGYADINKYKLSFYKKDGTTDIEGDAKDKTGEMMIKSKGTKISIIHRYELDSPEYKKIANILESKAVNAKGEIEN